MSGPVYPVLHEHRTPDEQDCVVPSHGALVRSTPSIMVSEMVVVAVVPKYSSTTNTPAISAFKWASPLLLLAIQLCVNVLSVIAVAIVPVLVTAPFTDIEYPLLDALYCTTTVNHEFCTINAAVMPSSRTLSQAEIDPVNRMTNTIVKPPLLAMLKVRDPASRYCDLVRSKLKWPLPFGPPAALYVGMVPTAALFLVEIDANEGLGVRAINLVQAVVEYEAMTFTAPVVHVGFCGRLLFPQQSCDSTVPERDLYPIGHELQDEAVVIFENVSAAHARHGPELGVGLNEPFGQDTHTELFVPFGAFGAYP